MAVEDKDGWHGKPLDDPAGRHRRAGRRARPDRPGGDAGTGPSRTPSRPSPLALPRYELGQEVATRKAYGEALAALGAADGLVVALDGEVSNSTYAEIFKEAHPERFFEMFIAEQQMVAAAVGLQVRGWKPFASTFAAFFTRAYDFIRMAAVSRATIAPVGLARRRLDRRGRPVADGAGGPGDDAGRRRQHGALPVRREPDGAAGRGDGRPRGHLLPAHDARGDAGPLRARRGVPRRRQPRPPLVRRRTR